MNTEFFFHIINLLKRNVKCDELNYENSDTVSNENNENSSNENESLKTNKKEVKKQKNSKQKSEENEISTILEDKNVGDEGETKEEKNVIKTEEVKSGKNNHKNKSNSSNISKTNLTEDKEPSNENEYNDYSNTGGSSSDKKITFMSFKSLKRGLFLSFENSKVSLSSTPMYFTVKNDDDKGLLIIPNSGGKKRFLCSQNQKVKYCSQSIIDMEETESVRRKVFEHWELRNRGKGFEIVTGPKCLRVKGKDTKGQVILENCPPKKSKNKEFFFKMETTSDPSNFSNQDYESYNSEYDPMSEEEDSEITDTEEEDEKKDKIKGRSKKKVRKTEDSDDSEYNENSRNKRNYESESSSENSTYYENKRNRRRCRSDSGYENYRRKGRSHNKRYSERSRGCPLEYKRRRCMNPQVETISERPSRRYVNYSTSPVTSTCQKNNCNRQQSSLPPTPFPSPTFSVPSMPPPNYFFPPSPPPQPQNNIQQYMPPIQPNISNLCAPPASNNSYISQGQSPQQIPFMPQSQNNQNFSMNTSSTDSLLKQSFSPTKNMFPSNSQKNVVDCNGKRLVECQKTNC